MQETTLKVFRHKDVALSYETFGTGQRVFIAFHGYGQDAGVYKGLPDNTMTLYALNLPFHGACDDLIADNEIKNGLREVDLLAWMHGFLDDRSIERFSLIGFSIGARLVLSLIESQLPRIQEIHLLAPDGFIFNPAYFLATRTSIGRGVFGQLPRYRSFIHFSSRALNKIGLLDPKVLKLVLDHTSDTDKSTQLFKTWTYLRYLHPDTHRLGTVLALESKEVIVHLGKFDAIIPLSKVLRWSYLKDFPDKVVTYSLGHRLLVERVFVNVRKPCHRS